MSIVDRYVLRLYIKVFLVCFASLTGLYVVIETLNRLEEFLELGRQQGSLASVLADYFVGRAFTFFDRTSHLLALMAAIFTITWLQRTNEMTAVMAAGVPQWRVIKPVLVASLVVSLTGIVNREILIPQYQQQLVHTGQAWSADEPQPMQPRVDYETDYFFTGNQVILARQTILQPSIHLDRAYPDWGARINAEHAVYMPADDDHPAGYHLVGVSKPRHLEHTTTIVGDKGPRLLSPVDHDWLKDNECFIASNMEFDQLVNGDRLLQYSSTWDLIRNIRNPSQDYGAGLRVSAHARLLRPVLDLSLLLLGLPIVVARRDRNIFVATGWCVLMIVGFIVTILVCHGLASYGMVAPFVGAWVPVVLFVPLAAVAVRWLDQ